MDATFPQKATMSVPEFARIMGTGRTPTYQAAREDRLPVKVIRIGRRMLISTEEVRQLLSSSAPNSVEKTKQELV